jgi:adenylate kinase
MKQVILITGTPCTGKTTISKQLTTKLDALYINLTEYAKTQGLTAGEDKTRKTLIINEEKMQRKIAEAIDTTEKTTIIIDGHYATAVVPKRYVTHVFVLRRNPTELRKLMEKRGFSNAKQRENLEAEILDTCLIEALQEQDEKKICELDITGKTVETVANEILTIINENKKCQIGKVNWIDTLEKIGLLDEYLNF